MVTTETRYEHIVLDERGIPFIGSTTMKVIELVMAQQGNGWSTEELADQFPYLTRGQIHSALAYYWDHQGTLDDDIVRRMERVDDLQRRSPTPPIVERLRAIRSR
jgi:uncharacterized protein (DUF433 family)